MSFIAVTAQFGVAPQLLPTDMAKVKSLGYATVVNNRPDGEPGHPSTNVELQKAAQAHGLQYVYIPIYGMNFPADAVEQMQGTLAVGDKVLAFCRTGTRSINLWVHSQSDKNAAQIAAAQAGYNVAV